MAREKSPGSLRSPRESGSGEVALRKNPVNAAAKKPEANENGLRKNSANASSKNNGSRKNSVNKNAGPAKINFHPKKNGSKK